MVHYLSVFEGFLRKNIVAASFFSVLYTNILNRYLFKHEHLYLYMFSEKYIVIIYGQMSSHAEFQLPITF